MRQKLFIALAGYPGTGKSNLARYLAEKFHFHVIEGSALLRNVAEARGAVLKTRQDFDRLNRIIQHERGAGWVADAALSLGYERLLLSGLRAPAGVTSIHNAGGFVIALTCPPEICIRRLNRSDAKNPQTIEQYNTHLLLDTSGDAFGSNTALVMQHADFTIDTSGPVETTYEAADQIIDNLLRT